MEGIEGTQIQKNDEINKKIKEKKPRTEKQIEAFKRCAEKRRLKLVEKENLVETEKKEKESQQQLIQNMMDQINQLKNQVQVQHQQQPIQVQTQVQTQVQPQVQPQLPQPVQVQQVQQVKPAVQQYQHQQHKQHQHQSNHMDIGMGLGYNVVDNVNVNATRSNNKRDIRGMDPYADERQGMMEKVYARNVNMERQREMDRVQQRTRFADENSIQLLHPQPQPHPQYDQMEVDYNSHNNNNNINNDRRGYIEAQSQNMSSMIRTGVLTNQFRKAGAIAVNGLRVASRR